MRDLRSRVAVSRRRAPRARRSIDRSANASNLDDGSRASRRT
jgi:hypothetical protein